MNLTIILNINVAHKQYGYIFLHCLLIENKLSFSTILCKSLIIFRIFIIIYAMNMNIKNFNTFSNNIVHNVLLYVLLIFAYNLF